MTKPVVHMPTLNTTGYAYMIEFNSDLIKRYVANVHTNNRLLYDQVRQTCPLNMTSVPPNTKMVTVDSSVPGVVDRVYDCQIEHPEDLSERASWGFRGSVVLEQDRKTRVSVGASLTHEEVMELAACFCPPSK